MGSVILLWRVTDQPEKENLVKEHDSDHVILISNYDNKVPKGVKIILIMKSK